MKNTVIIVLIAALSVLSISDTFSFPSDSTQTESDNGDHKYIISILYKHNPETDENLKENMKSEKKIVQEWVKKGLILEGFIVQDHSKGWMIVHAHNKHEVLDMMNTLPLHENMYYRVERLGNFQHH